MTGTFHKNQTGATAPDPVSHVSVEFFACSSSTFPPSPPASEDPRSRVSDRRGRFRSNPKRRLRGFVIEFRGRKARVGFVDRDGGITEYLLPASNLRRVGITAINQPFEMDEFEETSDGGPSLSYQFRPMAPARAVVFDRATTVEGEARATYDTRFKSRRR